MEKKDLKNETTQERLDRGKRELDCLFKVARGEMTISEMRKELGDD